MSENGRIPLNIFEDFQCRADVERTQHFLESEMLSGAPRIAQKPNTGSGFSLTICPMSSDVERVSSGDAPRSTSGGPPMGSQNVEQSNRANFRTRGGGGLEGISRPSRPPSPRPRQEIDSSSAGVPARLPRSPADAARAIPAEATVLGGRVSK